MKTLAGALGMMMMFFIPSEEAMEKSMLAALGAWVLCFGIGVALLRYAGAFKRTSKQSRP
jgi:hypothetical protein